MRRTGGLADSVFDISGDETGTGFIFDEPTPGKLLDAVGRGVRLHGKPKNWRKIQKNAMKQDFSWKTAANRYISLYKELV